MLACSNENFNECHTIRLTPRPPSDTLRLLLLAPHPSYTFGEEATRGVCQGGKKENTRSAGKANRYRGGLHHHRRWEALLAECKLAGNTFFSGNGKLGGVKLGDFGFHDSLKIIEIHKIISQASHTHFNTQLKLNKR